MFVLVHKDRVLRRMDTWKVNAARYILNQKKVALDVHLPGEQPEELPFVIDENTYIAEAVVVAEPEFDPMVEYLRGPLFDTSKNPVELSYELQDHPIEQARGHYKDVAAATRYQKEIAGTSATIQDTEVSISTARENRSVHSQKYVSMSDTDTVNWKFPEGWLELSKSDLKIVIDAIESHVQAVFDEEKATNDEIDAASTKTELQNITIE